MTAYHVKIHNAGRGARVIHDGQKPIRIGAGETVEQILTEDTIKRLQGERSDDPDEPKLDLQQGDKAEETGDAHPRGGEAPQHAASGEDNASHKRRGPAA